MEAKVALLVLEALFFYLLALGCHAMRRRFSMAFFYAMLGALTAVMSWVTDAGIRMEVGGISFMLGSTVFYTTILLSAFVVYVFDGPAPSRLAILVILTISTMMPLIAQGIHAQAAFFPPHTLQFIPQPSLRINFASVCTTLADLFFLAIAWEILGRPFLRIPLWLRTYLTLLAVMFLDVVLFTTGAFYGTPAYLEIMKGTLLSRFLVSLFAFPCLYGYLHWQGRQEGNGFEKRPVLAILQEMSQIRTELSQAQKEIERRKQAEMERETVITQLQSALKEIKTLRGFLPICAQCKKIRDDDGYWKQLESYISAHSDAKFSHGICPECAKTLYPDTKLGKPES